MKIRQQQGLTYIGWAATLVAFAFGTLIVMRALPVYMDYWKLVAALESMKTQSQGSSFTSREEVRKAIRNRLFYIDDVETIAESDIKIKGQNGGYLIEAKYTACADIVYNLSLCARFDESEVVNGSGN